MQLDRLGTLALALCVGFAAASLVVPQLATRLSLATWLRTATAGFAATATLILGWALVTIDGRIIETTVATSRATPWWYRISGVWGSQRGSLVTYVAVLAAVLAAAPLSRSTGRAAGAVVAGLAATSLWIANPFDRLDVPVLDGGGISPILRHWAMLIHPPILYTGLALVLAGALVALDDPQKGRRWLLAGWIVLTLALALGARWAYEELGWGGFWAWDPVENAGLLPWLTTLMWVHVARAPRPPARTLTVLAGLAAWFVVAAGVLTRSGIAPSVHDFAEADRIGRAMGVLAIVSLTGAAVLVASRIRRSATATPPPPLPAWLLTAAATLAAVTAAVFVGTGVSAAFRSIIVTGRFYALTVGPIALAAGWLSALALARPADRRLKAVAAASGAATLAVCAVGGMSAFPAAGAATVAGGLIMATRSLRRRRHLPAAVGHLGLTVFLAGIAGTAAGSSDRVTLLPGQPAEASGYTLTLQAIEPVTAEDHQGAAARIELRRGSTRVARLRPELNRWGGGAQVLAETDRARYWVTDLQVVLRRVLGDRALVELYVRPLVDLVWIGALLMATAGGLALSRRRAPPRT